MDMDKLWTWYLLFVLYCISIGAVLWILCINVRGPILVDNYKLKKVNLG